MALVGSAYVPVLTGPGATHFTAPTLASAYSTLSSTYNADIAALQTWMNAVSAALLARGVVAS